MLEKPRVLLLQPPVEDVYHNPPLGLAYLGASLENGGYEVEIIDAAAPYADYAIDDLVEEAKKFKPCLIGVTLPSYSLKYSYPLLKALSEAQLDALVVAGGPHPTLFPDEVLDHWADIAVRHDGEEAILELVEHTQGRRALKEILGISYREGQRRVVHNPLRSHIKDLDVLPFPAKHLFREEDYVRRSGDYDRFGCILTSRGCPGRCSFCSKVVRGRVARFRSAESVLKEIVSLMDRYNIRRFRFIDDIFTVRKNRVMRLCELILEEGLDITWTATTRLDFVDQELLRKMKEAGCRSLTYGIESANPATLKRIRKGFTPGKAKEVARMTQETGILCSVNFMWGFPWETAEEIRATVDFIEEIRPYVTAIAPEGILIPYPGTELYDDLKDEYHLEGWWLKDIAQNTTHGKRARPILFKELFFNTTIFKWKFFSYPPEVVREIVRAGDIIGRHNMWLASGIVKERIPVLPRWVLFQLLVLICKASEHLYKFNPRLESTLMRPFFGAAEKYQHLN